MQPEHNTPQPEFLPARIENGEYTPRAIKHMVIDHLAAMIEAEAAWSRYGDLEDAHPHPAPKVQIGRSLRGRNDDGTDNWEPVFAYSEQSILDKVARHRDAQIAMCGRDEAAAANVRASYDAYREEKLAELRQLEAALNLHEENTGIKAARRVAEAASERADMVFAALLATEPTSLDEVRLVAKHLFVAEKHIGSSEIYKEFVQLLAGRA